jgi:dimethylsulfoniopropionate demethylase
MTRANNPLECALDRYCARGAPIEFIGRDALREVMLEGAWRLIRGVRLHGEPLPACIEPWPVRSDGIEIGSVTSATDTPGFNCGVRITMLDRGDWRPGEQVVVETPEGARPATVADLPLALNFD